MFFNSLTDRNNIKLTVNDHILATFPQLGELGVGFGVLLAQVARR